MITTVWEGRAIPSEEKVTLTFRANPYKYAEFSRLLLMGCYQCSGDHPPPIVYCSACNEKLTKMAAELFL